MAMPNDFASIVSGIYQSMVEKGYTGTEADLAVALSALSDDNGATTKWIDLGASSAYAIAVEHGYAGTEEEWIALLMSTTQNAQIAQDSADSAAESAASARQSEEAIPAKKDEALQAIASAESGALQSVNTAGTTQTGNVNTAGQTQVQAVNAAGTTQIGLVEQEGSDQKDVVTAEGEKQTQRVSNQGILEVQAVAGEGTRQTGLVTSEGTTQVGNVNSAGTTQVSAVQNKGAEVLASIPADYSALTQDVSAVKSSFDEYGALNLQDFVNGTYYPGAFTLVYSGNTVDITGSPTGSGFTHSGLFSNTSAFPEGLSAGQTIQLAQNCDDANVHFRFFEYVNGTANLVVDIAGSGTVQHTISEDATGCVIRYSFANGQTYSHVKSTYYIFTTLTKQQTQEQILINKQTINGVDERLTSMKAYMPTSGDKQLINIENAQIVNARVSDSTSVLIADNNYQAIIVPAVIETQNTYWAKLFAESVTLNEIKLYTFNDVNIGTSIAVNKSDSYNANKKQSRVQTTASALYFVLVLRLASGTVEDVLNSAVIAMSNDAPAEYTPYYVTVDEAINNALGKKTSPDCIEVGISAKDYVYTNINTAVSENTGKIIKINYGIYETEVENLATDKTLIGTDADLCILEKHNGEYAKPPIEIAGGLIKNLTVKMINNPDASQYGYCVHSDDSQTANKTLLIENCIFDNDLYRVIGMGVRGGETVIFRNCQFIGHGETQGQSIYIHNSSGDKATVKFHNCYFQAVNECLLLQGWSSDCAIDWEFINCTCYSENYGIGIETVWTDYATGSTHDQNRLHEFSGKFTLLPTSHGNNISVLNYTT